MEKIIKYLEKEGYTFLIRDTNTLIIPWKLGDLKFHITVNFRQNTKWVVIDALIASFDEISEKVKFDLYRKLLIANHELPEINYEIDEDGNILCSVDMDKEIINYENFLSEFEAIPYGIKYFLEKIAPSLNITVTGRE